MSNINHNDEIIIMMISNNMDIEKIKEKTTLPKFNIFSFRKLNKDEQKIIFEKTNFLPINCSFSERLFCFNNNLSEKPRCKICNSLVEYTYWLKKKEQKYRIYCSNKCSNSCSDVKLKKEKSYMIKYGVPNPSKSKQIIKDKTKNIKEKYGGIGFSSKEIKEKISNTIKRKYNVSNIMEIPEIVKKLQKIWSKTEFKGVSKESKKFIKKYLKENNIDESLCYYGDEEFYIHYGRGKRYFYDLVVFKDIKSKEEKKLNDIYLILEYDGSFWHPTIDQSITYREKNFGITKIPTRELYTKDLHKEYIAKKYCDNFIRIRN